MTTPAQPLRASPIQIEGHEFLDIEVHAAETDDAHGDLGLAVTRTHRMHENDPYRWRVELMVKYGGEKDGKQSVYSGSLRIAGYFRIRKSVPAEKVQQLVEVTGASILYGACREMLATLTARGSRGMLSLPSVSFVEPKKAGPGPAPARAAEDAATYSTASTSSRKGSKR